MALRLTEVDGVPTIIAPSPGRTAAGLVFRVGQADETLARSGITHLTEHLALFPLGLTDYHYNGTTGPETTSFHISGSAEDVATFLTKVCESLNALPMQRLAAERSIVRTEWSSRTPTVYDDLPLWRYGARSRGLASFSEPGVRMIGEPELDHWTRTWFTRDNAVLWIAGELPVGLRLRLPAGQRMALPLLTSALPTTPAYFANAAPAVVMDAIVTHSAGARVFAEVLERTLYRDLRYEDGVSYTASTGYSDRGDGSATITAGVDALPERLDAALGGFVDVLAKLRVGRIDESDVSSYVTRFREQAQQPDAEARMLPTAAFELLTGRQPMDLGERVVGVESVAVADVHAVAQEAMSTALLGVPRGRTADWAGFVAAPTCSDDVVAGVTHRSRESESHSLHVGAVGVTSADGSSRASVRFDAVAAMLAWPDGARQLTGYDGVTVHYEPTLWETSPAVTAHLDAAVDPSLVIRMPARAPDTIPQPRATDAAGAGRALPATRTARRWSGWELAGLIASLVIASMLFCLGGLFAVAARESTGQPDDIGWGWAISTFVCTAVSVAPAVVLLLRRRR